MTIGRKYQAIDLLKLHSKSNTMQWNNFLTKCLTDNDIDTLLKTLYGIQVGMTNLSNKKMNTPKIVNFFIRCQTSIEKTIIRIIKMKQPCRNDHPVIANIKNIEDKRERDIMIERFLRGSSF
jgi:hypothetical protein